MDRGKLEKFMPQVILLVLLLLAGNFLSYKIGRPWVGYHDFNGAVWSNIARNYNRYGFIVTKFGQVNNYGALAPQTFSYYIHHPPLLPILVAVSFRIFGESEAAARYVPILFSLGTLVFVFLLSKRFWGILGATIASATLMAAPQYLYFGRMVNHEALTLFFIVAATYYYVLWREKPSRLNLALFVAMLIGGGLSGWPMYLFMGSVFLLDIYLEKRVRKQILIVPLVGLLLFGAFLIHISILKGSSNALADLADILKTRTGLKPEPQAGGFGWSLLGDRVYFWLKLEYPWPILVLALLGVAAITFTRNAISKEFLSLVFMLFLVAVLHVILFPNGAWYHDYWVYYLLAPLSLAAAPWGSGVLPKQWMNFAAWGAALLLLGGLVYQSRAITQVLYTSGVDYRPKIFGGIVRSKSDFAAVVLIPSLPYIGPKANYYADRLIVQKIDTIEKLSAEMEKYRGKNIVFIDTGAPEELKKHLASRYNFKTVGDIGLRIFDLSKR